MTRNQDYKIKITLTKSNNLIYFNLDNFKMGRW